MYVFGIDIPLVAIILALGVIGVILLLEISIVLLLISYHMRNSKRLEDKVSKLALSLTNLQKDEFGQLERLNKIEDREEGVLKKLSLFASNFQKSLRAIPSKVLATSSKGASKDTLVQKNLVQKKSAKVKTQKKVIWKKNENVKSSKKNVKKKQSRQKKESISGLLRRVDTFVRGWKK